MTTEHGQVKVSRETHRRLRIAAAAYDSTMAELVGRAVEEYLREHREEVEHGIEHARRVLLP